MKRWLMLPVLFAVLALAAAGCGSSSSSGSGGSSNGTTASSGSSMGSSGGIYGGGGSTSGSAAPATSGGVQTVAVANSKLGKILVDGKGRTLYLFMSDTPTKSTCSGACAAGWPPLIGKPKAGAGVDRAKLGTITRSNGAKEVTYNGHPLYHFIGDKAPGETNGQGLDTFGALWWVLSPAGNAITSHA